MHFIGLLILSLAKVAHLLLNMYMFLIGAAVVMSWVRPDPYNPIVRFIYQATFPVFRIIRRYLPRALFQTTIDWTPMAVLILLIIIDTVLVGLLFDWASIFLSK